MMFERFLTMNTVKKTLIIILAALLLLLCACSEQEGVKKPSVGAEIVKGTDGSGLLEELSAVDEATVKAKLEAATGSAVRSEGKELADGVMLYSYTIDGGNAYAVVAELDKVSLKASTPYNMKPNGTNQLLASQAQIISGEVLAGVNANAFNNISNAPIGIAVQGGKQTYEVGYNDGSACFGITKDGKAFACSYADYAKIHKNKTAEVVSGTHILVSKGKALSVAPTNEYADRTGAGFTADRSTVILVFAEDCKMETLASLLIGHGACMGVDFGYGVGDAAMYTAEASYGTQEPSGVSLFIVKK